MARQCRRHKGIILAYMGATCAAGLAAGVGLAALRGGDPAPILAEVGGITLGVLASLSALYQVIARVECRAPNGEREGECHGPNQE